MAAVAALMAFAQPGKAQAFKPQAAAQSLPLANGLADCDDDGRWVKTSPVDVKNLNTLTLAQAMSDQVANMAEYAKPAVVQITGSKPEEDADPPRPARGSGFICRADGLILTNWHVVKASAAAPNKMVYVKLSDGRVYPGTVIGADPQTELAVIRIQPDAPLPTLRLADSDSLRPGDFVAAFGHPHGYDWTFTSGIITARRPDSHPSFQELQTDVIQTTAPVQEGNSGGPYLDLTGKVDGLATAILGESPTNNVGNSANAIRKAFTRILNDQPTEHLEIKISTPVIAAREFLNGPYFADIPMKEETRAKLITLRDLLDKPEYKDVDGALLTDVVADGPAAKVGLKKGDIITAVDGRKLNHATVQLFARYYADETLTLEVFRKGEFLNFTINPKMYAP